MSTGYTLSQLSEQTGVKPRTLQFWTANGVLEAEKSTSRKGTGVHRRWPWLEVEIAAVFGALERYGLTIGTLYNIAAKIRGYKAFAETLGLETPEQVKRYLNEEMFLAFRGREFAESDEALASELHLEKVPAGTEPRLHGDDLRNLRAWGEWCSAKEPQSDTFMKLQVSEDGSWVFDFSNSSTYLEWGTENTYFVIKLSKILKAL
jgi:hypothetical protein